MKERQYKFRQENDMSISTTYNDVWKLVCKQSPSVHQGMIDNTLSCMECDKVLVRWWGDWISFDARVECCGNAIVEPVLSTKFRLV